MILIAGDLTWPILAQIILSSILIIVCVTGLVVMWRDGRKGKP